MNSTKQLSSNSLHLLSLPWRVPCGFPSPADDFKGKRVDVLAELVKHPNATFLFRNRGVSMLLAGIHDGDILVVDRAERVRHGDVVLAVVDGDFTCKYVQLHPRFALVAATADGEVMAFSDAQEVEVWGVVISSFRLHRPCEVSI